MDQSNAAKYFVYCLVEIGSENGPCKVGVATNLAKRLCSLQGGNWRELKLAWTEEFYSRTNALQVEQTILMSLRPNPYGGQSQLRRLKSEWLDASPTKARLAAARLIDALMSEDDAA